MNISRFAFFLSAALMISVASAQPAKTAQAIPGQAKSMSPQVTPSGERDLSKPAEPLEQQLKTQIELLSQQNKLLEESHDSILSTVQWSLGGVFGMAFLLAGFSWLNSHKLYEMEKSRLESDVDSKLKQLTTAIQSQEQEQRIALLNSVDSRLESFNNRLSTDMSDIRANIEDLRQRVEAATEYGEALKTRLSNSISRIDKKIYRGTAVAREIEEHIWDLKDIPENILITQGQGLAAFFAAKDESGLRRVLDRIKETIEEHYVEKKKKLPALPSLLRRLESARDMLPIEVSEIIKLIESNQK